MALDLTPVKGGRRHRLRLALTMAWRDIRRHKGRSALIAALIALPVFAMSLAATAGMSMVATPAETAAMELGQTQGRLTDMSAQNAEAVQSLQGDISGGWGNSAEPDPDFVPSAPADVVPAGYTAIPWQSASLTSPVGKAQVDLNATVTDALNPAFKGKYTLLKGFAPTSASEALGTPGLLERFGLQLGDKLTTSAGTFAITGTLRAERQGDGESFIFLKPSQIPANLAKGLGPATVYLVGDKPLVWSDAKAFNAKGVMLTSRSLLLDPPSKTQLGDDAQYLQDDWRQTMVASYFVMGSLIAVLALLEVGLLAGAAFAVGARKQQRDLALLAASGAEGSMVRNTVTAGGLWLGLVGGIVGAVLGSIVAVIGVLVVQSLGLAIFPGLHLMWLPALGLVVLGVAAGIVAAMVPARAVAKQATLAALKSGRTADAPSKWTARIGLGLLLLAALAMASAAAITVATRGTDAQFLWAPWLAWLVVVGAVLLVFGLICLTGRIIGALTAKTSWLPVPLRLAARDSARNRGRTVPAVAAVLAAATLSGALMVGAASTMQQESDEHQWQFNLNQTGVRLQFSDYTPTQISPTITSSGSPRLVVVDPQEATNVLKETLGPDIKTQLLRGTSGETQCSVDRDKAAMESNGKHEENSTTCPQWALAEPAGNRCKLEKDWKPKDLGDWRCTGPMSNQGVAVGIPAIVAGGEAELTALLGRSPSAQALQTLADGGMVITNKIFLESGDTAKIISFDPTAETSYNQWDPANPAGMFMRPVPVPLTTHDVTAMVEVPEKALNFYGMVSEKTAAALKIPVNDQLLLATAPHKLSQAETDKVRSAMTPMLGAYNGFQFENGPNNAVGLILWTIVVGGALITLSAAGITAGLALADGRSDHATLASVGADPKLRKALSGSQTLMTAMLGTVLGLFAGAVPVVVVLSFQRGMPIVLPWLQMGALMILVPLFGAGAAWLLTKGKLPMTRRQTLV
jgi:putative ABC transport system permease protein